MTAVEQILRKDWETGVYECSWEEFRDWWTATEEEVERLRKSESERLFETAVRARQDRKWLLAFMGVVLVAITVYIVVATSVGG